MSYRTGRPKGVSGRLTRALRPRALLAWVLLLLVVLSTTSGLTTAVKNLEALYIFTVAVIAVTVGWLLALLPMQGWMAGVLGTLFGIEYLLVRVGGLGDSLVGIVGAAVRLARQVVDWYFTEQPPDWAPLPTLYVNLWVDMGTLLARTTSWLSGLISKTGTRDIVGSALVWGLGVWLYNVWAGFVVRRHHKPLLGMLPGGLLLSFVLSYTGTNPYILLPVVGLTLVLMAVMSQTKREEAWTVRDVDYSQGLWGDVAVAATGISIALVLAAAIAPSITAEKIANWIRDVTASEQQTRTEAVAEGLGLEQHPEPAPPAPPLALQLTTDLPTRHLIGSGPELSRQVVMYIETGELRPLSGEEIPMTEVPRHYWRSMTYDWYFGRGWATSNTALVDHAAGETLTDVQGDYLQPLRQTVRLVGDQAGGIVFVDGVLVSVDQDFSAALRWGDEVYGATTPARSYTADSLINVASVEQLRAASPDYPETILERYLELPADEPERVIALARSLTATEPTEYDRAVAIEQYLRQFPYTLDVPTPGPSDDIADYFLFNLQEGYCDYYATAMVVLARAAGLPSRLVVGYVNGRYDPAVARYIVTAADAHAWPEIYFPGYGWIQFEPTGGRPPIHRRTTEQTALPTPSASTTLPLVSPDADSATATPMASGLWLLIGVGAVVAAVGAGTGLDSMRLLLATPEGMVGRLQRRLRTHAKRLRTATRSGDTPRELADTLVQRLKAIGTSHGFSGVELVEPAADEVQELTDYYIETWYSPAPDVSGVRRRQVVWTWWRLRWRLWLAWLWRRTEDDAGPGHDDS